MSGLGITSLIDAVRTRANGFLGLKDFHVELKRSLASEEIYCALHCQVQIDEGEIVRTRGPEMAARDVLASIEKTIRASGLVASMNEDLQKRVRELEDLLERVSRDFELKLEVQTKELEKARADAQELERFKTYYQLEYQLRHGKETA